MRKLSLVMRRTRNQKSAIEHAGLPGAMRMPLRQVYAVST